MIAEHVIVRLVGRAWRERDRYEFFSYETTTGLLLIRAGCRTMVLQDYAAHVAANYPNTPKAAETLAILDRLARVQRIAG